MFIDKVNIMKIKNGLSCGLLVLLAFLSLSVQAAKPLTFDLQQMKNQQAIKVNPHSWGEKYLLIAVGYTGCPDICPTTLLDMRDALTELDKTPEKAAQLQPLFITIDPISDTLADITKYTSYFDSRIIGLRTQDFGKLDNIVKQLHASYGYFFKGKQVYPPKLPKGYTVMHSIFIYLYSPKGKLLNAFPYNTKGKNLAEGILRHLP